eukprot:6342790-Prorocentrum_lima.AAC.1
MSSKVEDVLCCEASGWAVGLAASGVEIRNSILMNASTSPLAVRLHCCRRGCQALLALLLLLVEEEVAERRACRNGPEAVGVDVFHVATHA